MSKETSRLWKEKAKANRMCLRCGKPLGEEKTQNHKACTRLATERYKQNMARLKRVISIQKEIISKQRQKIELLETFNISLLETFNSRKRLN